MRFGTLTTVALVACMVLVAEARDWGFSKDTVSERNPGGDTVWLANNGADTLRLDSLFVEDIAALNWTDMSFLYGTTTKNPSEYEYRPYTLYQFSRTMIKMDGAIVPPNDSVPLRRFDVWIICLVKRTVMSSSVPDDFVVRLRFKSWEAEEDTLIVKGHYCFQSAIKPQGFLRPNDSFELLNRDLKGRRVVPSRNFPALRR